MIQWIVAILHTTPITLSKVCLLGASATLLLSYKPSSIRTGYKSLSLYTLIIVQKDSYASFFILVGVKSSPGMCDLANLFLSIHLIEV